MFCLVFLVAALAYSYFIASAGFIFAALQAGYRLPNVPSRIAAPKPMIRSSGLTATVLATPVPKAPRNR